MSYLSSSENVGYGGIPQTLSEASCATQYKMAVEGVSGNCSDINTFIHDGTTEEQTYLTHANDNFYHSKFKIDPNELYTFHDSDVIAGEITVSHTEDHYVLNEDDEHVELTAKQESSGSDIDILHDNVVNGVAKDDIGKQLISNGHYNLNSTTIPSHIITKPKEKANATKKKICLKKPHKTPNTKAPKAKRQGKVFDRKVSVIEHRKSVHNTKNQSSNVVTVNYAPVISNSTNVNTNTTCVPAKTTSTVPTPSLNSGSETFLDVFKREQGLTESPPLVKKETVTPLPVPTILPGPAAKKAIVVKSTQSKARRGRGPAVHEALQRIQPKRAIPVPNRPWHAPGEELFQCGPLNDNPRIPYALESSSSDDDLMPDIDVNVGPMCVEEMAAESRAARLALRKAALRKQMLRAQATLNFTNDHLNKSRMLASTIKKQLSGEGRRRLPTETVSCLLAARGLPSVLTSRERRRLRESGWSGGESSNDTNTVCAEESCDQITVPCAKYCPSHITLDPEQRLYAACAAVFAGGARCMQPLLPLQDQTPLCAEHAWKRDNYDKLVLNKPKKATAVRKRVWPPPQRPPRRPKRRRRPSKRPAPAQALSDVNVCSNSSAYDSSEETAVGGLSETEYMAPASHELEVEVGQVPADDILDPAVLSQIPDEAFTEFFNQAEGGAPFAESSELAAALEAVLDERALDSIADCVFTPQQIAKNKIQHVQASVSAQPSTPS